MSKRGYGQRSGIACLVYPATTRRMVAVYESCALIQSDLPKLRIRRNTAIISSAASAARSPA